ncbi:hypothetical protein HanLR1_Chr12g0453941 [Helianthus annuus]|nr:hypothetical protein HanHA89_Chr12g0477051 [Helianthus annuus]KAJ0675684.1 hypothetical protein HanLR1_Chr12g0453941 [Helianthus annuus]
MELIRCYIPLSKIIGSYYVVKNALGARLGAEARCSKARAPGGDLDTKLRLFCKSHGPALA